MTRLEQLATWPIFYDRLFKVQEHMNKSGDGLRKAVENHNNLVGSFERHLIRDTAQFKELGIQVTRELSDSKPVDLTVRESTKPLIQSPQDAVITK